MADGRRAPAMRRRALYLAGVAGGVLPALAGCATSAARQQPNAPAQAPVTLRSWLLQPGFEPNAGTDAAEAAIKEKYPWITLEHEAWEWKNYVDKVTSAAVSDTLPDLLYCQGPWIQGFIKQGFVRPLDDFVAKDREFDAKDFPEVARKLYSAGGKQYAFPYDHGPILLWFNKDLFDKEGVALPDSSWTTDRLVDAARRLTKPADGQWGMAGFNPGGGYTTHGNYLGPWGTKFLNDEETETYIDSKEAIDALSFWADLRLKQRFSPMPEDTAAIQGGEGTLWWNGKIAMRANGPWFYRDFFKYTPSFVMDIADWPKGPKGRVVSSMGSGYLISASSKHAEPGWLYLSEFLGKDENRSVLNQYVKTGFGTPARYSALGRWEKSQFAPPGARVVAPALRDYAVVGRPVSAERAEIDKVTGEAYSAVWAGQSSMADAARTIKQLLTPILERNRRS